jgi:hypothetical protein
MLKSVTITGARALMATEDTYASKLRRTTRTPSLYRDRYGARGLAPDLLQHQIGSLHLRHVPGG